MKTIVAALILFGTANSSFAGEAALKCSRGQLGEDTFLQVSIDQESIKFEPHESFFEVPRAHVKTTGHSYEILNERVQVSSEGTEFEATIDSLIVYDPAANAITLTLAQDGFTSVSAERLECSN